MPCGKKIPRKLWDHPKNMRTVFPSKYEKNEASVKEHWKNVVSELEASYQESRFWETTGDQVEELVGDVMFKRLRKIFNLPVKPPDYEMKEETSTLVSSAEFYVTNEKQIDDLRITRSAFSMSDISEEEEEEEVEEVEDEEMWSQSTLVDQLSEERIGSRSMNKSSKLYAKSKTGKYSSSKSFSSRSRSQVSDSSHSYGDAASSGDDIIVHAGGTPRRKRRKRPPRNPYYEMLYCNDSETDMIKWKSKYKQKKLEVSASDEFSKRAEIKTKMIAREFYEWWSNLGSSEYKSEIQTPEDIESLFQVWFNEHASHGMALDPRIIPCVLTSIADYVSVPENSCPRVLEKQIMWDIHAETAPAHTVAFDSSLSPKLRHIPPKNNTKELWHCVRIPEDLRSMSCVWGEIQHLTSTKSFLTWLRRRPHLPVPPILQQDKTIKQKRHFVVPSGMIGRESSGSEINLAIPFSQVNIELKDVLSKLMHQ